MIWMSDATGACLHLNRMQREFWNVEEEALASFDWTSTMHPDDVSEIVQNVSDAISNRTGMSVEGRYRNAQGHYRTLHTNAQPRFSPNGEFLGMIGANVDITERKQAEHLRREVDERFRLAVEAAPCGMLMLSHDGRIEMMNAKVERLFEYSMDEILGQKIEAFIPSGFPSVSQQLATEFTFSGRPLSSEEKIVVQTKSGTEIPVEIGCNPIRINGETMTIAAIVDISERKRADAQRELLLAELNHRVKNTLAVVQGLAHQTFREKESPESRAFEGRLIALATAHNLLTRANWESAPLRELVLDSLQIRNASNSRINVSGPEVQLAPQPALALTLALHELFTNALKYGALSNESGNIDVEWSYNSEDVASLKILWRETGGPPVTVPRRRGFGSILLERTLAEDLNGQVSTDFRPEGLQCIINASTVYPRLA
jgi:PAS domain S-box-containing protein